MDSGGAGLVGTCDDKSIPRCYRLQIRKSGLIIKAKTLKSLNASAVYSVNKLTMELDFVEKQVQNILLWNEEGIDGYVKISIILTDIMIDITIDNDTDELIFKTQSLDSNYTQSPIEIDNDFRSKLLAKTVGKVIASYWIAKNNKGYIDLLVLGIDDVIPSVFISCAASQLEIRFACELI